MKQQRDELDLSSLYTGYHRLLQAVSGIKEIYYRVSSADDYLAIIQEGLFPVPLSQDSVNKIEAVLQTITEREVNVLRQRLGINNDRHTLKETAEVFDLTPERVRQIEAQALMKLRHPARTDQLKTISVRWADVQKRMSELESQLQQTQIQLDELVKQTNEEFYRYREAAKILCGLTIERQAEIKRLEAFLDKPVADLELSVRTANCLEMAQIQTIRQLVVKTEPEMLKYRNFGRKSLNELKNILAGMELSFGRMLDECSSS